MQLMRLISTLLCAAFCGCKTSISFPPLPPGASKDLPVEKSDVVQPMHTLIVSAYFGPGQATIGFFLSSTDLVQWVMADPFPYPTQGAWVSFTNYNSAPRLFFMAGFTR